MQHRAETEEPLPDGDLLAVFRALPDVLLLLTPDFRMVEASDARLEATATTRADTLGRDLFEVFPDNPDNEDAAGKSNLRASLMRVLATGQADVMALQRYDLRRPDGSFEERYWRPVNVPVLGPDGEVRFIIHRVEDATTDVRLRSSEDSQKLVAAAFENQRQLLRRIIDNAPVAISLLSHVLVYEWVNPTHVAWFGGPAERYVGRSLGEALGPEAEAQLEPAIRQVLGGEPFFGAAFPLKAMVDGHERTTYWDFSYQPVRDEGGEVVGILSLAQEVSARVEKERLQLERVQALKQTDQMKDQFLGILSHELRTPINAILGFGSVLADGLAGDLTPDQMKYLGKMLDSTDALLGLVNDLLDMSRVQAGKFALDLQTVEVASLIRNSLAGMAVEAIKKGLSIGNEVPSDLPALRADTQRLRQVVDNLVMNAIKYTPEGGVITVRASVRGEGVRVEVADTGLGVSPEQQARIFEAFTQVDMTSTRAKGGVGLGLSIVKALVEAHGGAVGVASEGEDQGSTFFFTLPLASV